MFTRIPVLFLILSLVLCPFRCMGLQCGHLAGNSETQTCRCCHHSPGQTSHEQPADSNPPRPDDSSDCCNNCLCHGVIQTRDDFQQVCCVLDFLTDLSCVEILLPARESEFLIVRWDQPRHADAPTGLTVRILHQSFLL